MFTMNASLKSIIPSFNPRNLIILLFRFFQNIGRQGKPNLKFHCGKRGSLKATVPLCWWWQKQNQRSWSDYIQCGCFYRKQRCKKTDFLTGSSKAVIWKCFEFWVRDVVGAEFVVSFFLWLSNCRSQVVKKESSNYNFSHSKWVLRE